MTSPTTGATAPAVFNFQSLDVRAFADAAGEPWFCAADVCAVLGYRNPRTAIANHCREKGVLKRDTPTESGAQEMTFINEGNLYRLIVKSRKPEAQAFEQQVMEEILPAIRKTGRYEAKPYTTNPTDTLTADEADLLRTTLRDAVTQLPSEKRASFMVTAWSKLKSHFGVSYRSIPRGEFEEALSLLARHIADRIPAAALQAHLSAPVPTFANRRWFIVVAPDGRETARPLAPEDFITNLPTFPAMLRDPGFHVTDPELFEILRACTDRLTSRMPATIRSAA